MQAFDDASRGPWGAAILLWKAKSTAILANAGAAVVLLCLAFEPFTQQMLKFSIRPTLVSSGAGYVTHVQGLSASYSGVDEGLFAA